MNPFTKIWFWLLVLSIIGFILSVIFFEIMGEASGGNNSTPVWIWIIFILSIIFLIVAFILYIIDLMAYNHNIEIAEACGELPPKKKIECPKKKCIETPIINNDQCVGETILEKSVSLSTPKTQTYTSDLCSTEKKSNLIKERIDPSTVEVIRIDNVRIINNPEEAFSAASLKPLESLAPSY